MITNKQDLIYDWNTGGGDAVPERKPIEFDDETRARLKALGYLGS